jgi:hypothetical protein
MIYMHACVISERWREQQTKMGGLLAFGTPLLRPVSLLSVFASCIFVGDLFGCLFNFSN